MAVAAYWEGACAAQGEAQAHAGDRVFSAPVLAEGSALPEAYAPDAETAEAETVFAAYHSSGLV